MFRNLTIIAISTLLIILNEQSAFSQNRPFWVDGCFMDAQNSYIEIVSAIGWEAANAKQKAYQEVINRRSLATGTEANVNISDFGISIEGQHDLITKSRVIDEYIEQVTPGTYKAYLLVQTAKNPSFQLEPVTITNKYPFSARVFVPGYAQIYKGSYAKGISMIASEVVFACGIATAESLRKDYAQHAKTDDSYISKEKTCSIIRDVSIAGLVGVYVWSVIDGIVAPGKKHIVIGEANAQVSPNITMNYIGCTIKLEF